MARNPVALGLVVCENVIIEETTRNVTMVNCFSRRTAAKFPSEPIDFVAFAFLSDGAGTVPFELVVTRLDTFEEVRRLPFEVEFADRQQVVRCTIRIRRLSFPVAGEYQASLFSDGIVHAQRKFLLSTKEQS